MKGEYPICPWCGEYVTDSPNEDIPESSAEIECAECTNPVMVRRIVSITYETERLDD